MTAPPPPPLVEFRHYELVDGGAGAFVEHFEAHFLASQEALGMEIVGQFTVAGRDDRFVWVRRYPDPAGRAEALAAFYGGPVWAAHGPRANELMLDFSDVHLLVADASGPALAADHVPHDRRGGAAGEAPATTVVAAVYDRPTVTGELAAVMDAALAEAPAVRELGRLVTAGVANEFPALPVHEERAVLWLLASDDDAAAGPGGAPPAEAVAAAVGAPGRVLRLRPTGRSTLR